MSKELFPESDAKFAKSARAFAGFIERDPERYHVPPERVREIVDVVRAYELAFAAHNDRYNRSMKTRIVKDRTRAECEKILRTAANGIRINREIVDGFKEVLGIKVRPTKLRRRRCPKQRPLLAFQGVAGGTRNHEGTHVIRFGDGGGYDLTKPGRLAGAERLELFVDLVPIGERIPTWPGERNGGRMWSLGNFTRSPIKVRYPKCEQPMVVVYWGRWGAGNNDFGEFSETLVTRIEGRDLTLIESPIESERIKEQSIIITTGRRQLPDLLNVNAIIEPRRALPGAEAIEVSETVEAPEAA